MGLALAQDVFPFSIYLGQALLVQTASVYLSHGPVALLIVLEVLPASSESAPTRVVK